MCRSMRRASPSKSLADMHVARARIRITIDNDFMIFDGDIAARVVRFVWQQNINSLDKDARMICPKKVILGAGEVISRMQKKCS